MRSFMRSSHVPCTKPYFGCNFRRTFPAEPNTRNAVPIGRFILLIGVPKETKDHESRVGVAPAGVHELFCNGHRVLIQKEAGRGAGISDDEFNRAGGTIVEDASSIWSSADLIVKVKEPSATERQQLQPGQILFTYLHLAPDTEQADDLIRSQATCIAYETVTGPGGGLPLLTPMSEVAGRLSVQVGAHCLENAQQGRGILLGGVPGVAPANVLILGGGVAGSNAALMAVGLGADVTLMDRSADALRRATDRFGTRVKTAFPSSEILSAFLVEADLVIGTVLVPGAAAPKLITRGMLQTMKPGSVLVDVSIDQGGCAETSKPTNSFLTDFCRGWNCPLLCNEHAGMRRSNSDVRTQQRHIAIRARNGQQRLASRPSRRNPFAKWSERACWANHASRRCRGFRTRITRTGFGDRRLVAWRTAVIPPIL